MLVFASSRSIWADANCPMPLRAAELVKILDRALQKMLDGNGNYTAPPKGGEHPDWGVHCSQYLRSVMREVRGDNLLTGNAMPVDRQWTDDNCGAECLVSRIRRDDKAWANVNRSEVQDLASSGVLVVGTWPGHVGIAFPLPDKFDSSPFQGKDRLCVTATSIGQNETCSVVFFQVPMEP